MNVSMEHWWNYTGGRTKVLWETPVPWPLHQLHILRGLARDQILAPVKGLSEPLHGY